MSRATGIEVSINNTIPVRTSFSIVGPYLQARPDVPPIAGDRSTMGKTSVHALQHLPQRDKTGRRSTRNLQPQYSIPTGMYTYAQLDGLCSLIAGAWLDAKDLADRHPDAAHLTHLLELELATHLAHRLLDRAGAA